MRDASRANANQAGALTQRHLRAGAQNFVFISWSCLQLSGFNFMNKKNLLKSFSDAATTTHGRDVSLLYSAAIFRPPPGTHFLHCIHLLAKMSQKKVKATPKVDEMKTSVAADLQDAVEFVVSFNSFSFPALRPLLHQMAGGKIFPFNWAGSLPRGGYPYHLHISITPSSTGPGREERRNQPPTKWPPPCIRRPTSLAPPDILVAGL